MPDTQPKSPDKIVWASSRHVLVLVCFLAMLWVSTACDQSDTQGAESTKGEKTQTRQSQGIRKIVLGAASSVDGYVYQAYLRPAPLAFPGGKPLRLREARLRFALDEKGARNYKVTLLLFPGSKPESMASRLRPVGVGDFMAYNFKSYVHAAYVTGAVAMHKGMSDTLEASLDLIAVGGSGEGIKVQAIKAAMVLEPLATTGGADHPLVWKGWKERWWDEFLAITEELSNPRYRLHLYKEASKVQVSPDRVHIFLRHDVDNSLLGAIMMAAEEKHRGLRATYFIQMNSGYFGTMDMAGRYVLNAPAIEELLFIQGLKHEVGYHTDVLMAGLGFGVPIRGWMLAVFDRLRRAGIELVSEAPHGSYFRKKTSLMNQDTFVDASTAQPRTATLTKKDSIETITFPAITRGEVGLNAIARLRKHPRLSRMVWLSDRKPGKERLLESIRALQPGQVALINIHPSRWNGGLK